MVESINLVCEAVTITIHLKRENKLEDKVFSTWNMPLVDEKVNSSQFSLRITNRIEKVSLSSYCTKPAKYILKPINWFKIKFKWKMKKNQKMPEIQRNEENSKSFFLLNILRTLWNSVTGKITTNNFISEHSHSNVW